MAFAGTGLGFIVLSRRMIGDSRWRDLAAYTLLTCLIVLALRLRTPREVVAE